MDADFGILQQIFADVANDMRRDPLEHLLVLTYEFDDQQLVNLLSGRRLADNVELNRNQLRFIADMHPVVVYDARKTREFNQLPHFLDLLPVNPGAYRCHHAKAYLFVTRGSVRLVLGSFNLTRGGLFENREVFLDFFWSDKDTDDLAVLRDFRRLLAEGYSQWAQPAAASVRIEIANALDERIARWQAQSKQNRSVLLPSGYARLDEKHGLQRISEIWKTVSNAPPQGMFVVSPFFDKGEVNLADRLAQELGVPNEVHIVTDEANITKLGRRHYGPGAESQVRKLNLIPAAINDVERSRIARANEDARLDGLQINRPLHAKILILCGGSHHLVYVGSANFTLKAWNGDNQELGVARIEEGNADALIARILDAFAADASDAYGRLGESPSDPQAEDDEDYVEQAGYPNFIDSIQLEDDLNGRGLVFRFQTAMPARLQDYDISWGRVSLSIEGVCAKPIARDQAYMPLQGGRNLLFGLREVPDQAYLLPFVHDAALTRQQDLLLFPSAEDWLRYYLHPAGSTGRDDGEYLPGDERAGGGDDDSMIDREANVVVSMQRYLDLFSGVEAAFHRRAQEIAVTAVLDGTSRSKEIERCIAEPLRFYARLLEQEHQRKSSLALDEVYLFRLGELILLCKSLVAMLPELAGLAQTLSVDLTATSASPALHTYLDFIKEQLSHV